MACFDYDEAYDDFEHGRLVGRAVLMPEPSTAVTDGIEVSPDDQIIAVRRGAYVVSVAERTGGWQGRGTVSADESQS